MIQLHIFFHLWVDYYVMKQKSCNSGSGLQKKIFSSIKANRILQKHWCRIGIYNCKEFRKGHNKWFPLVLSVPCIFHEYRDFLITLSLTGNQNSWKGWDFPLTPSTLWIPLTAWTVQSCSQGNKPPRHRGQNFDPHLLLHRRDPTAPSPQISVFKAITLLQTH